MSEVADCRLQLGSSSKSKDKDSGLGVEELVSDLAAAEITKPTSSCQKAELSAI